MPAFLRFAHIEDGIRGQNRYETKEYKMMNRMSEREWKPPRRNWKFPAVIKEYWVDLIKLNIAFLLCCLPVVTIPVALLCLCSEIYRMLNQEDVRVFRDFIGDLRKKFVRSFAPGLFLLGGLALCGAGVRFWVSFHESGAAALPLLVLLFLWLYLVFSVSQYAYPMAAVLELPMGAVFRNALILSLSRAGANALALVLVLLINLFVIVTSPFTLPVLIVLHFSLCGLVSMCIAEKGIRQCIL